MNSRHSLVLQPPFLQIIKDTCQVLRIDTSESIFLNPYLLGTLRALIVWKKLSLCKRVLNAFDRCLSGLLGIYFLNLHVLGIFQAKICIIFNRIVRFALSYSFIQHSNKILSTLPIASDLFQEKPLAFLAKDGNVFLNGGKFSDAVFCPTLENYEIS